MKVFVVGLAVLLLAMNAAILEYAVVRTDQSLKTAAQVGRWAAEAVRNRSVPVHDSTSALILVGLAVLIRAVWSARRPRDREYERL